MLLTTPRRTGKRSTTPRNTLRILSRALAKETGPEEEAEIRDAVEEDVQANDLNDSTRGNETVHPTVEGGLSDQISTNEVDPYFDHFELDLGDGGFEQEEDDDKYQQQLTNRTPSPQPYESPDKSHQEIKTPTRPALYSDIAIPQGLAPEAEFLDPFNDNEEIIEEEEEGKGIEKEEGSTVGTGAKRTPIRRTRSVRKVKPNVKRIKNFVRDATSKPLNEGSLSVLIDAGDQFMDQLSIDLQSYSNHSKTKSIINIRSLYLLFKRQRIVNSVDNLLELVDGTLPLESIMEIRRNVHKI